MKRTLIAAALAFAVGPQAFAADLPPAALPPPPPTAPATYIPAPPVLIYDWTGFYVGVNAGYGFGNSGWTAADGISNSFTTKGFLGGGTIGANYQWGPAVLGIEGDIDWSNLDGKLTGCGTVGASVQVLNPGMTCETASDWLATVRGRLGYAFDRILVFGTGGVALANVQGGLNGTGAPIGSAATGGPTAAAIAAGMGTAGSTTAFNSTTQVGWTAGAGIEAALSPRWSVKVEYMFVDLPTSNGLCTTGCNFTEKSGVKTPANSVSFNENIVRAGLNFKFGGW